MRKRILTTGGAGFIGRNLVAHLEKDPDIEKILVLDKLSYAGRAFPLPVESSRVKIKKLDLSCSKQLPSILREFKPTSVYHLAAESHVDRSILSSEPFIQSNIVGTFKLLEACREYLENASSKVIELFRFIHVSTDEVYGDLGPVGRFSEKSAYRPSSPYSASKAGSDHLVRAWHRTYNFPAIVTNCSNNYGPYQHSEKFIPLCISRALNRKSIPIYGKGTQIRDWLYVDDHLKALILICSKGIIGETYLIGADNEKSNLSLVTELCRILDRKCCAENRLPGGFSSLIEFVSDRPGHDTRYAVNANKLRNDLKWAPTVTFEEGLLKTISWYLDLWNGLKKNQAKRMGAVF